MSIVTYIFCISLTIGRFNSVSTVLKDGVPSNKHCDPALHGFRVKVKSKGMKRIQFFLKVKKICLNKKGLTDVLSSDGIKKKDIKGL